MSRATFLAKLLIPALKNSDSNQNPYDSEIKKRRIMVNTNVSFYNWSVIKGANL